MLVRREMRMKFVDWLQLVSALLVAAALALNALQLREIARQSHAQSSSLSQLAYGGVSDLTSDPRFILFPKDPDLLAWYLASRGFKATTHSENMRRLYVMAKLIQHETNFVNYSNGFLAHESWAAWTNVLRADLGVAEFQEIWQASRDVYVDSFAVLVDSIIDASRAATSP
jgi:hypothetical protein